MTGRRPARLLAVATATPDGTRRSRMTTRPLISLISLDNKSVDKLVKQLTC